MAKFFDMSQFEGLFNILSSGHTVYYRLHKVWLRCLPDVIGNKNMFEIENNKNKSYLLGNLCAV